MSAGERRLYSQGVQMLQVGLWVPLNPREGKKQDLPKNINYINSSIIQIRSIPKTWFM